MPEIEIELICVDRPVLAANKPGGLLTEAPLGIASLVSDVKAYLKRIHDKPGNVYLGIPHRLDRPVSGVILFATNSKGAARLSEEFEQRRVIKSYQVCVEGAVEPGEGQWVDWLLKREGTAHVDVVPAGTAKAKEARLSYRVVKVDDGMSLLDINLETGRMHQIRVQCAARGHAVIGDVQYGSTRDLIGPVSDDPRDRPIALHANAIQFRHPVRYDTVTVEAPLPAYWPLPIA
ncbi:Ribosomal large subunit pseudouridine synthase D [Stratiformator vulcanicus]|uniref:Ribosomal large subunit pseudouridine synthase D n=1 Tax=Stratiformator vulcanicus TaxID=2527980 RepID=A0A517QZ72_9PLAN|nr:Ribosomal large subunit pseudouridine synthase D [Stratiformator vulcanicus]